MFSNVYQWIIGHKKLVLAACVILILLLVANSMTNNEMEAAAEKQKEKEKEIQEAQRKISELTVAKRIDHKALADEHYTLYQHKNGNVIDHYSNAVYHYEKAAEYQPEQSVFFKLGKLYHLGVPDSYRRGQKQPGILPDSQKALFYYTTAAQLGSGEALLNVGDIYRWGLQDVDPNVEYAKQLYLVLRQVGNDYLKGIAKDRILQIKEDEGSVIGAGVDAGNFDSQFHETFSNYAEGPLEDNFDVELDSKDNKVNELIQHLQLPNSMRDPIEIETKTDNNPHNVTDHVIEKTIQQAWTKLKASTPMIFNTQITFRDIKRWILAQREEEKKQDALMALEEIAKSVAQETYEDSREIEALILIWNRIHCNINKANRNILKQNFFNELAECVEHDEVVCQKGRIARYFDALNTIDPEVRIVPKWGLMEEMKKEGLKLRNAAMKRAASNVRDAINSPFPSPEQVQLGAKFNEQFKRDMIELFHKKYVDSGVMSADLLKTELKKWTDAF